MITINNKKYEIPEWNFGNIRKIEQCGLSILKLLDPANYMFTFLNAFVSVTAECDSEQADFLIEQHILGGGDISELYKKFADSIMESPFFKKTVESLANLANKEKKAKEKTED